MQLPAVTLAHAVDLVRAECRARKGQWRSLAAASKGAITWRWILTFAEGRPRPSLTSVVALARVMGMELPPVLLIPQKPATPARKRGATSARRPGATPARRVSAGAR